ncbi:hypothetical protein R3P38DRAFT_3170305 [Favolaschia claudopus]|uniref:Uncharacterized protein n=1 Tax=Favolaschia claudopus TaxID=2862362 RepID=A0AAW0DWJ0_9AGAR
MPQASTRKKKDSDDAPQKRGNPGDFRGARREWLQSRVADYCKASDDRTTRDFWKRLLAEYWAKFPWDLPMNEDPPADLEGLGRADSDLSAEELAEKNAIKDKMDPKIKRWFSYARHSGKGGVNPFGKWLSQLRRVDERAPKRLALHQVYMQDDEKNKEINRLLKERFPELVGRQNSIKERTIIARELLDAEPEEIREEYRARGEEEYQEALEEFKGGEGADAEAEEDADARLEARTRLAVTVQPLLDSIRAITGSQVLLVTGTVVEGRFDVRTLHGKLRGDHGLQEGLDFTSWDPHGYKNVVMDQWMRYIIAAAAEPHATGPTTPVNRAPAEEQPNEVDGAEKPDPPLPAAAQPNDAGTTVVDNTVVDNESRAPTSDEAPAAPTEGVAAAGDGAPAAPMEGVAAAGAEGEEAGGLVGDDDDAMEESEEMAKLGRLAGVGGPLLRGVRAMTPNSRAERIFELTHMNEFYRNRENNKAMALEKLDALGIRKDIQGMMAEIRAANKRPAAADEGPRAKRVKTKAAAPPDDDDDDYDSSGEDDDDEDRAPTPTQDRPRPRPVTRARAKPSAEAPADGAPATASPPPAPAPAVVGAPESVLAVVEPPKSAPAVVEVPKWAPHCRKLLETGEGGELWKKVVEAWWKREEKANFKGPSQGAAAKERPSEIKGWIARARVGGPQPPIKNVFNFTATWWVWWMRLNPTWREKVCDGRRLAKEGEGDWKVLASQTGPNGLLNALICLRWWRDVLGSNDEREIKEWLEAVEEVDWVLNKMLTEGAGEARGSAGGAEEAGGGAGGAEGAGGGASA